MDVYEVGVGEFDRHASREAQDKIAALEKRVKTLEEQMDAMCQLMAFGGGVHPKRRNGPVPKPPTAS